MAEPGVATLADLQPILDALGVATMLASGGDGIDVEPVGGELKRLGEALGAEAGDDIARKLAAAKGLLDAAASGDEQAFRALRAAVHALIEAVTSSYDEMESIYEEVASSFGGGAFELPPWVDEALYSDFISTQRMAIEEIEAAFVALEQGEPGEDGEDGIDEIKRRLHTLKGESGTVGLEGLSQLYHALESLVLEADDPVTIVSPALAAVDWLTAAMVSYADLQNPMEPVEVAIQRLDAAREALHPSEASDGDDAWAAGDSADDEEEPADGDAPDAEEHAVSAAPVKQVKWDDETAELIGEFLVEATEGVETADRILLEADGNEPSPEDVNALFRVFHTIKGVAGFLAVDCVLALAHSTETLLNKARDGEIRVEGMYLDLVFEATNAMRELLNGVRAAAETMGTMPSDAKFQGLISRLAAVDDSARPPVPKEASPKQRAARATPPPMPMPRPQRAAADVEALDPDGASEGSERVSARGGREGSRSVKLKEVVKVDLDRVDGLVDLIGELVILESMVANALKMEELKSSGVMGHMGQLNKIVRDLQSLGLALRMVPLRGVFQKMARLVRDVSHKAGKSARLVVAGEKTEMDRRLVESISDPLVHMVRNSVDHGLETPEERVRLGKPEVGTIMLSASHDGGNIVIEIADDGKGLNREAILEKAVQKGVIPPGATLSDDEVWQLIFAPGFSTAAQVTEISGRGVGMDVVKRNIEALRGRITIDSVKGRGTTFKLHLPLTLAIISGLLVGVREETYILPTLSVVESFKPDPKALSVYGEGTEIVSARGEVLPLIRMSSLLDIRHSKRRSGQELLVIVQGTRHRAALLVDDVLGQQNIVIKTLGAESGTSGLFSGAAILSDGKVGLILNVDKIITTDIPRGARAMALSGGDGAEITPFMA